MRKTLCTLVLAVWLAPAAVSMAQDAALVDAAKKEGKLIWYTSLAIPSSTAFAHFFMKKYPGVEVEIHRTGSQRVLQRVMQEATAGIKNVDVIHTSDAGHFVLLKEKGLIMKYVPKSAEPFPAGFKDRDGFYFGLRATLSVPAYNPKVVAEKDAPKSWKDLLDTKWRGKLVTAHPGYSGIIMTHVLALVKQYGWEYFQELAKNKLHITQSANDPAGVVASGERARSARSPLGSYAQAGESDQDRVPERGRAAGGLADGHRRRRAASERCQAVYGIYSNQGKPAGARR